MRGNEMRTMIQHSMARLVAVASVAILLSAVLQAQNTSNPAATLPASVAKAFQQAYPSATISTVVNQNDNNRSVYRIESVDKGRKRVVLYEANGSLIEVADQVEEKELPAPVAAAMHSHRRAIYVSGLKVSRGGNVEYRLTLRGSRKTAMVVKPDGTVLSFQ